MTPRPGLRRRLSAWLCILLWATLASAMAQPTRGIAVLYPDISEPYRSVFARMIEGIQYQAREPVLSLPIGNNPNIDELAGELRRQNIRVVIALGRNGLKVAAPLGRDLRVVVGGVVSVPEAEIRDLAVSSLAPDPALLFARLQSFMPAARRIFVVYDPGQNGWLMRLARVAATARGLELVAYEAGDLKTALQHYQTILAAMESGKDALWLPPDTTTVQDATVLPLVLQEGWSRNLTVFSSNVAHVRRGVLFSLVPDNLEVGRNLADYALGHLTAGSPPPRGVQPSKAVQFAVNLRTAGHLGLDAAARRANSDLVFPEQ